MNNLQVHNRNFTKEPSPIVITRGSLTAMSDGDVTATYERKLMAISLLESAIPVKSEQDLESLLLSLPQAAQSSSFPALRILSPTPSFAPLLDSAASGALSRLTINIANACNLWCSYCYADHGTYHSPASLMSAKHVVEIVARCIELYPRIAIVQFFGGEPLLNPRAIEATCNYLEERLGSRCPEFVATTNGTVWNSELERIIVRYRIGLTISVDGPPSIHDRLRPAKGGKGSHSSIVENIDRLKQLEVPYDFECTYTSAHFQAGFTVCDLLDYFQHELSEFTPHIAWSYLPRPTLLHDSTQKELGIFRNDIELQSRQYLPVDLLVSLFRNAARKSMSNISSGNGAALDFVIGIVQRLSKRQTATAYCPAFTSQLSIAADGSAYPCFMFIGDPRLNMGNILDPAFPGAKARSIWQKYTGEFGPYVMGSNEWYSGLLSGCIAGDYISSGSLRQRAYEPVQEAMIQEVILGLARELGQTIQGGNDDGTRKNREGNS